MARASGSAAEGIREAGGLAYWVKEWECSLGNTVRERISTSENKTSEYLGN